MGTVYITRDIINETLALIKNIKTDQNIVLLGNAAGFKDSSRIINDEANNASPDEGPYSLIEMTGKDVSLTIGGDYSKSSGNKIYNLYAVAENDIYTDDRESSLYGYPLGNIAVKAGGDLTLYLVAQTGAPSTGTSSRPASEVKVNNNQDASISIYVKSGDAAGFSVAGKLNVASDLVGELTAIGEYYAKGITAASMNMAGNFRCNVKVTANKFFGFVIPPYIKDDENKLIDWYSGGAPTKSASAVGIGVDGDLNAGQGVWSSGSVIASAGSGATVNCSGAELENINMAAYAVSAGGSVFFNHLEGGSGAEMSARLGSNNFTIFPVLSSGESGAIVEVTHNNKLTGARFTAAALAGGAVRLNRAEDTFDIAANVPGNSVSLQNSVDSGAAINGLFESNIFSAAGVSAASELALGEGFGANVTAAAQKNQFGAAYADNTESALGAAASITLSASAEVNFNRYAAVGISAGEIVSGADISGVISAAALSNSVLDKIYDYTDFSIAESASSNTGTIVESSLLTRRTTVAVSGNNFDAAGIRASSVNSTVDVPVLMSSIASATKILYLGAEIYNNILLSSGNSGASYIDQLKSAAVSSGAAMFQSGTTGGVDVTGSVGAALNNNRIGVDVIDSGATVISKNIDIDVHMADNAYGAFGIDTDELTLGKFGGKVTVAANSNGIVWSDSHGSGGGALISRGTLVTGSGNSFDAVGIGAKSLLATGAFSGNVNATANNNSGILDFNVKGVDTDNALFRDNLGGKVTVVFQNNNLQNNVPAGIEGGTATVAGIYADTALMVIGRIESTVNLTVTGNRNFSSRPNVYGIHAKGLVADAFSGKITISSSTPGRSLSEADQLQLDIVQDIGILGGKIATVSGDAFDINGSITVNAIGIISASAMSLRVSGDITANGVSASVSGFNIEIMPGYAIVGDGPGTIKGTATSANKDAVELASTANITGIIDLGGGENTLIIDSNATVGGSTLATGGLLTYRFDLNGAAKSTAVLTVDGDDASLYSVSTITVNLNNAVDGEAYKLFEYGSVAEGNVWLHPERRISFSYRGNVIDVELTVNGSVSTGEVDFNDEYGYNIGATVEYKNRVVTVTVTRGDDAVLDEFGGTLATTFDTASHQAVVSWTDAVEGYDEYEIEYSVDDGKTITVRTTMTAAVLFGIGSGANLAWRVRGNSLNGEDVSKWSDWYTDTVDTLTTTVTEGTTDATLSWTNDLSAYDNIVVTYSLNGGDEVTETLASSATSLDIDASAAGYDKVDALTWRIRGESEDGSVGSWVISDGDLQIIPEDSAPDMTKSDPVFGNPDEDESDAINAARALLTWNPAESKVEIANYTVEFFASPDELDDETVASYFDDPGENTPVVFSKLTTASQVLVTGIDNGSHVYWRVKATDVNGGESEYAYGRPLDVIVSDTEAPVLGAYSTKVTFDVTVPTLEFKWKKGDDGAHGSGVDFYELQYKLSSVESWDDDSVVTVTVSESDFDPAQDDRNYVVNDIAVGTYDYRIRVADKVGNISGYLVNGAVMVNDVTPPDWSDKTVTVNVNYDKSDPLDPKINAEFTWNYAVDPDVSLSDATICGSGVKQYTFQYKLASASWDDPSVKTYTVMNDPDKSSYSYDIAGLAAAVYSYRIFSTDNYSNNSEYLSGTFGRDDLTPPEGTFVPNGFSSNVDGTWIETTTWELDTSDDKYLGENDSKYVEVTTRSLYGLTVTVSWQDTFTDKNGVVYMVEVADNSGFSGSRTFTTSDKSLAFNKNSYLSPVSALSGMNKVYWRVTAKDGVGNVSPYTSATQNFEMVDSSTGEKISFNGNAVSPTGLSVSTTKSAVGSSKLSFSWSAGDGSFGVTGYTLKVTVGGKTQTYSGIQAKSYTLTGQKDGKYTWSVVANSGNGTAASAAGSAFVVDTTGPTFKSGAKSSAKASLNNLTVKWDAATDTNGVKNYVLQYGTGNYDKSKWFNTTVTATSFSGKVGVSGDYNYRIYAVDSYSNVSEKYLGGSFIVRTTAPGAPTVTASTTKPTNKDVTLTVKYSAASAKKQYSTDDKTWKTYTTAITVGKNGTYYFRGVDVAGNPSKVTTYKVANIDKTAPDAPKVKASTTAATNKNITLTATFSSDSAKKQYSTDKATWKTYSKAISVGSNGTYYFRGVDAVGNASTVTTYKVTNIDKTAPNAPTVKASTTKPTNKNVTLTATFSSDSAKKQYSTDKKSWKTYSSAVSVGKNGTYYFRGVDAAGNVSSVKSIKVSNIDKTAPKTPAVKASTTKATNKNVTLTATFSSDSAKKQYSTDKKTWKTYGSAVSVGKNGTYYFRGIDAAGNASAVKSIKVSNIDKTAPKAPTVKASTTKVTNKNVTLTATFSSDSAKKQYSTDKVTWKTYSKAISVGKNGAYYFRGIDAAGNASTVKGIKVSNIADTTNNTWADATELKGTVLGALDPGVDKVDYYNVGDVAKLMLDMGSGTAKLTFCNGSKQAVSVNVVCADSSEKTVSSLKLVAGDSVSDNISVADLDAVKYLKLESTTGSAGYKLAKLA